MSSALFAGLFAILGAGLIATSAACLVLWRRVRALGESRAGVDARRPASPLAGGEGGRTIAPGIGADELARRVDELAGKHRAFEARLARVEASTQPPAPIAAHPGGPRLGRRVDPGSSAISAGPTLISVPDLATPPSPGSTSEVAAELDRRFGPIWAMADGKAPADAIARETGYPIGQVELILGLRRRLLVAEAGPDA